MITKHATIIKSVRERVVTGDIKPGERLPTRTELLDDFGVSPLTLQRAFDELIRDGFLETRGKAGTFVSTNSPHLTHYALVMHGTTSQSRYYHGLAQQILAMDPAAKRVSCYQDIGQRLDSPDSQRLLEDIRAHRIAGIIFSNHPYNYLKSPLMTEPGIPRCAFMSQPDFPQVSTIYGDHSSFYRRAIDFLAERDRHRIGWLHVDPSRLLVPEDIDAQCAARGLQSRPSWCQFPNYHARESVIHAVLGILDAPPDQRPDALIIADDNLVDAATEGIVQAGITADELDVVCMCSFPYPPSSSFPVTRLGFDMRAQVSQAIANIDAERRGESPPSATYFPALFESECPANEEVPV